MTESTDQKNVIFDQSDILGLIMPGGALLFGAALLYDPKALEGYSKVELGGLGIVILAALVAGQCLRVIAWTYFDKVRKKTPRRIFDDVYSQLEGSDKLAISDLVDSTYSVAFKNERFLDLSLYAKVYSLLRSRASVEPTDRMERQFRLVSGLFSASIIVSVAYILQFQYDFPGRSFANSFAWGILAVDIIALFLPPAELKDRFSRIMIDPKRRTFRFVFNGLIVLVALAVVAIVAAAAFLNISLWRNGILVPLGLSALVIFLYVGSLRFANAVSSTLLIALSAEIKNQPPLAK